MPTADAEHAVTAVKCQCGRRLMVRHLSHFRIYLHNCTISSDKLKVKGHCPQCRRYHTVEMEKIGG